MRQASTLGIPRDTLKKECLQRLALAGPSTRGELGQEIASKRDVYPDARFLDSISHVLSELRAEGQADYTRQGRSYVWQLAGPEDKGP